MAQTPHPGPGPGGRPVLRRRRRTSSVIVATALGVGLAAALTWLTVRYASNRPDEVNLGSPVFEAGRADRLSRRIAADGPFLFKDPLNRGRELYLQHLGTDPKQGWLAVVAYAGEPRLECLLRWQPGAGHFVDPCTGRIYPPDGAGLRTYPGRVDGDGTVVVDLRPPAPQPPPL